MDWYGKYYESYGAGQCRYWYHFSIGLIDKNSLEKKKIGYWNFYYDGYFHYFHIWPFVISWFKRPITKRSYEEMQPPN